MNNFKKFLENEILPNYLEKISELIVGKEIPVSPDKYIRILMADGHKYCLLYGDYLDNDLDFNLDVIKKGGIEVKRFIPLIANQDKYVCNVSRKQTPYVYEPILDESFILAKVL